MSSRSLPILQNTDLVTFRIEVNGHPLPHHIPVYSIVVVQEVNRVPSACLYLADGDATTGEWSLSSAEYFIPGNTIRILAGYHNENELVFSGIVVSQTVRVRHGRLELKILCKDRVVALTTTKKSRHFADVTDSDVVAQLLEGYGFSSTDITATSVTHVDLVQYDVTDWDFIMMRLEANGLVCVADNEGFHAFVPAVDQQPVATLHFGANIIEFDADVDARRQYGTVTAHTWDSAAQESVTSDANDPSWTTVGNMVPADLSEAVGANTHNINHSGALPLSELQSWSDAMLLRSRMAFVQGRARVQGVGIVKPGTVVELAGFGERFNGSVWVSAVRHEIGQGNWLSDIQFGMPEEWHAQRCQPTINPVNGLLAAVSGLHVGVVSALAGDPAGESRIRVKIPLIDPDGQGVWARVATLDAGSFRGTFFLPEIDDEVMIGFLNDDPRHPVVLGMLHSSAHSAPEQAADDNPIKGYYSRSGMRIRFDDEKTQLTIDTPAGHVMVFDDDAGELTLTDSNGNHVGLSSSGISIESIGDLVLKAANSISIAGQLDVELKAGGQWKAEGSAGAEVSSGGITVVKGSLVQIN